MGRPVLGDWTLVLHPLFFLTVVTLDLGLYALMVYSGIVNKTLIAMMLAGLAGVLAVIAYTGTDVVGVLVYGGRSGSSQTWIEGRVNWRHRGPTRPRASRRLRRRFWWANGIEVACLVAMRSGLGVILAAGLLARALQARSRRRDAPAISPIPLTPALQVRCNHRLADSLPTRPLGTETDGRWRSPLDPS